MAFGASLSENVLSTVGVTLPVSMSSLIAIRSTAFSELTKAIGCWLTNRDSSIAQMLRSKPPNHFPSVFGAYDHERPLRGESARQA